MITKDTATKAAVTLEEFFQSVPPGKCVVAKNIHYTHTVRGGSRPTLYVELPKILLYCENCKGDRYFTSQSGDIYANGARPVREFIAYKCNNCEAYGKIYAASLSEFDDSNKTLKAFKYGEFPSFGPPAPPRLLSLIGPSRDYFLKGRRSENQGLGIAAFAYYRRVIEDQKNRIVGEITKVSKSLNAPTTLIDQLEAASKETQFSKAIEQIKEGLPGILLINGHNPLTLIHSALSEGLHELSDEECLERSTHIRVVMAELAERISQALKEDTELNEAVSKLLNRKKK